MLDPVTGPGNYFACFPFIAAIFPLIALEMTALLSFFLTRSAKWFLSL